MIAHLIGIKKLLLLRPKVPDLMKTSGPVKALFGPTPETAAGEKGRDLLDFLKQVALFKDLRQGDLKRKGVSTSMRKSGQKEKMTMPNHRRLTLQRKRLRAEGTIKTIQTISLVLLVLCFSMIPNLCFGESWISLDPGEASVSIPAESEVIQAEKEIVQNFAVAPSEPAEEETGAEEIPDPLEPAVSPDREDSEEPFPTQPSEPEEPAATIADPLEPVNRAFFHFNDKLYFWVLKPVASGYKSIVPEDARIGVRNFLSNLTTPVRLVNCLLQANPKCAGTETLRFVLNTTIGIAGFFDPAKKGFSLEKQDRDFGQTLGIYGMKSVFYIDWPILGPSNVRDTVGYVGDLFFDPRTYLAYYFVIAEIVNAGTWTLDKVNKTSLTLGDYENLKKAALDPYIAVRNAYFQYREYKIRNR